VWSGASRRGEERRGEERASQQISLSPGGRASGAGSAVVLGQLEGLLLEPPLAPSSRRVLHLYLLVVLVVVGGLGCDRRHRRRHHRRLLRQQLADGAEGAWLLGPLDRAESAFLPAPKTGQPPGCPRVRRRADGARPGVTGPRVRRWRPLQEVHALVTPPLGPSVGKPDLRVTTLALVIRRKHIVGFGSSSRSCLAWGSGNLQGRRGRARLGRGGLDRETGVGEGTATRHRLAASSISQDRHSRRPDLRPDSRPPLTPPPYSILFTPSSLRDALLAHSPRPYRYFLLSPS
jgi:hypothetical protein